MSRPLVSTFRDALGGVVYTFKTQRNARIHVGIAVAAIAAGIWLGLSAAEWAVLVLTICLVLGAEMLNTALEGLADAIHPDHNPLVGMAKDVAAGAVLISAVGAVVVGVLLFGPRLLGLLAR